MYYARLRHIGCSVDLSDNPCFALFRDFVCTARVFWGSRKIQNVEATSSLLLVMNVVREINSTTFIDLSFKIGMA